MFPWQHFQSDYQEDSTIVRDDWSGSSETGYTVTVGSHNFKIEVDGAALKAQEGGDVNARPYQLFDGKGKALGVPQRMFEDCQFQARTILDPPDKK